MLGNTLPRCCKNWAWRHKNRVNPYFSHFSHWERISRSESYKMASKFRGVWSSYLPPADLLLDLSPIVFYLRHLTAGQCPKPKAKVTAAPRIGSSGVGSYTAFERLSKVFHNVLDYHTRQIASLDRPEPLKGGPSTVEPGPRPSSGDTGRVPRHLPASRGPVPLRELTYAPMPEMGRLPHGYRDAGGAAAPAGRPRTNLNIRAA